MRNEQSAEKLMAPADCSGWHTAGALQPARRARYANVGAGPGEREEEKPAQRREMQMTGTEISAENPGLTAGAGARLSLTPSGLCRGCRGLLPRTPVWIWVQAEVGMPESGVGKKQEAGGKRLVPPRW